MKIKAIASICKKRKSICVCEYKGTQWIGDGGAMYPIYNLPALSKEQICAVFDIPEDKRAGYDFAEITPMAGALDDNFEGEQLIDHPKMSINVDGMTLEPLKTQLGLMLVNVAYYAPFADCADGYELYARINPSGQIGIAVKSGMLLIGFILPCNIALDKFSEELRELCAMADVALANSAQQEREGE